MKLPLRAARRPGFTLVEMLIVLAIIAVLVSLVAGAVLRFLNTGQVVQTQAEISQLNQAMELFKQKYGKYPPSKIFLANNLTTDYPNAVAYYTKIGDTASANVVANSPALLQGIFPKLDWSGNSGPIDWTGGQLTANQFKGAMLEGDQCLVFFLGGMQTSAGGVKSCLGFAANSRNPTSMANVATNYPPFFEFSSKRLSLPIVTYAAPNPPTPRTTPFGTVGVNPFFVYLDPYDAGMPYVYFSSYNTRYGYVTPIPPQPGECPSLASPLLSSSTQRVTINPYYEATTPVVRYLNPNTFQIISSGPDGDFGGGGLWNPGQNPVDRPTTDNQSNFNNGGLMGTRN